MGTTGIFISTNIKFKILPSINACLSDFTGFFALKTNQKIAIFVWIFTCVDFRGKITTKVCRNLERYHLILWHLSSAFKTTTRQKVRSWYKIFFLLHYHLGSLCQIYWHLLFRLAFAVFAGCRLHRLSISLLTSPWKS